MDLEPRTAGAYIAHALSEMLQVADRLGDEVVNLRPHGESTNAVAALVLHCCGVTEFWLGHVGLGRPSVRSREDEFALCASVSELRTAVATSLQQVEADLDRLEAGAPSAYAAGRQFLRDGDESTAALVLHVVTELFQHLGHAELTADALTPP